MTDRLPPIVVDARRLLPPEPMERTLEALDELQPGQEVLLMIPRQPAPLFDMLRNNGYAYTVEPQPDGVFHITIRQASAD
ncbi:MULTISPECIES: DUF2249 domain-containing protein [Denitromonas]|jgi:uncharacterized protein (DUF2249 family)|uniref:DUF2249 domain-containing protein n=2 Tax=Denitromonas TaxID=139331 RepID=A0A557SMP5_9RHOO|nr:MULTISPECIES: DUF2249 domain-containing protein [Denitromonas]TVO52291.1 DUF2249 domain-containing protein [Denitromonas halophila]TVO60417.1 DUF2249 domain-containing protein [Denitromonas ohlonensis]TVO78582.1 DUF2249 domain-containing protein [Denitromonas ohlonensis]TVT46449.1 MAG: DUF2249 domain-containing protein [Denitromonas halophila]TVT66209.1 MAG: DUF2249 domain-containing protein [Denitromonas halophila]